ncbi:putative Ig domain-containing protein [Thetidibacter halocola]|uniref:Dystroglycan-type cadherin-like domain-containing protein n=1 Tax=Thetidibacter halocola TaxID=2827239 RepID=A0A8J7WKI4_9RHOB|nr:putative Ig domain-containing protein [Thetidibacter halocola]MBS0126699.1 hypothetical protein [Thetidibacter halocola]
MTITQAQIDSLSSGADTALAVLDAAWRAQALAEALPLIGDGFGDSVNDATGAVADLRTALLSGLSTLSDAATYTAAELETALANALANRGLSGIVVSASEGTGGITLTIAAAASATAAVALAGDLALPGLALDVSGSATLAASAGMALTLGLDETGFFIGTGGASGLDLSLDASAISFNASATLGILGFSVADAGSDLDLDFSIDLTDANNDGKLRLSELSSDFLNVTMSGTSDLVVDLAADFGTGALPSVSATLDVDWDFANATVNPGDQNLSFGGLPTVVLRDVTLDLGSFLEDVVLPVLDAIQPILEPIGIALDVLTADITMLKLLPDWETLLDRTGDGKINLLDLLKLADDALDLGPVFDFVDLAQSLTDWAQFLGSVNLSEIGLNFGDYALGAGLDIRDFALDLANANIPLTSAAETLSGILDTISGGNWDGSGGGKAILAEMAGSPAFSLPLLEDPSQIIALLFGGDADLVEIDFPDITLSAGGDSLIQIPVFPGINVTLGGSVSAAFDLAFGYSTRGLLAPGATALDALNGLYVIDGEGAEATLSASIYLGGTLDALIASLYGGGDVTGTIELDIADSLQGTPGRLYYDEFLAALTTNPFSLFDASGSITAGLSIAARILGGDVFRLDSPRLTLAEFNFTGRAALTAADDPLGLADPSGGFLLLNIGGRADQRLVGSATDGAELVYLADSGGGTVTVIIDGYSGTYDAGSRIEGAAGAFDDQLVLAETLTVAAQLSGEAGNDLLAGGAGDDTLLGGTGDDTFFGRAGDDSLSGGDGADLFYGGAGADTIAGGDGEDMVSYVFSGTGVSVDLGNGTGLFGTAQGDVLSGIEVLQGSYHADTLAGSSDADMIIGLEGDDAISGAVGDDVLLGSTGADTLDGGSGADTMVGAAGDDVYFVDDAGDVVDENRYGEILSGDVGGHDEVRASIDWSIATGTQAAIEDLTLIGSAVVGTGNAGANVLTANALGLADGALHGGAGEDTLIGSSAGELLDGGADADSLIGHGGDDTYHIDTSGDEIVEIAGEGTDTAVVFLSTFALEADDDIEVMQLDSSVTDGDLTGNALDQTLIGALGDDTLVGGAGADALIGGAGTDRASYRNASAAVLIDLTLVTQAGGDAEGDTYTSIEQVEGSTHDDTLIGGTGDDEFFGLAGNDDLQGADGADTLWGGAGNDLLDGGDGADTLVGGDGDDTYMVDNALEQVTEIGSGSDLVIASVDWSLDTASQQNIEALTLTGLARVGTGNALANVLTGTAGDDTLDGLAGADTMIGGAGDDLYRVQNALDLVTDFSGDDRIDLSSAGTTSYDMSVQATQVEDLRVIDAVANVAITGNALDNVIEGNARNDVLRGGDGNDTLIAGAGGRELLYGDAGDDDLRIVYASRGDHLFDGGAGDADIMRLDWSDATSNVIYNNNSNGIYYNTSVTAYGFINAYFVGIEAFDLRSGTGRDILYGGVLDDTLHGGAGNDRLFASRGRAEIEGGDGADFASVTVRTAADVDLGLDFSLRLIDTQSATVTVNAGTAVETRWQGIEQIHLYTGAGDDLLDTRGVGSTVNTFDISNYFSSGDGDDTYATDILSLGSARFVAGAGFDRLILDWRDATSTVLHNSNSNGVYYNTAVTGHGFINQYYTDIEEIDIRSGAGADQLRAVGGRDRFDAGAGNDRVFGADKGDTVIAGTGTDWISLDLRFAEDETDPAEDIRLVLAEAQETAVTWYAGTADETTVQGVELIHLYTGAGDDSLDLRGIATNSGTFGTSNHFEAGAGDDSYAIDLMALGSASFIAGEGYDRLLIDWSAATSTVLYNSNSNGIYYNVSVATYGFVNQYYRDIEEIDIRSGSGADELRAVGGRDRFEAAAGNDRVFGADKGDTVLAGTGSDWISLDLRFDAGETDPVEDIRLVLADIQGATATFYAGTENETVVEGVEQIHLYTGAGDDLLDTRGIASDSDRHIKSHYFDAGDGDDTYATDILSLGSARFVAGAGFDRLILDWRDATSTVLHNSNSNGVYYNTAVTGHGFINQYYTDIEEIDIRSGAGADQLRAVGGRDRFDAGAGNDRVFGADKGDTVIAGTGTDWISLDLRFAEDETDPAEDIRLVLAEAQETAVTWYAGTADETTVQGVELIHLYTGAGDDSLDLRGIATNSGTFGTSNHFEAGAGDDSYAIDLMALGSASFIAGEGYDRLLIDWSAATSTVLYNSNSNGIYYNVSVATYGFVNQYYRDIEEIDIRSGSGADELRAVGGRDRFEAAAGNDRVFGADKGDTVLAGTGSDWISLDLRFDAGETDPVEDIRLVLADIQGATATFYAGTENETVVEGVEQIHLYTGAGDDLLDTRGIASDSDRHIKSHYFDAGDGDDTYATDILSLGSARFVAGAGFDRLVLDWRDATSTVLHNSNSNGVYYNTAVTGHGFINQYYTDIEEIDIRSGAGADQLRAVGGRDRFDAGAGNDRVFGADKGDTVLAGTGSDWISLDLRFDAGETDPAEDISLVLAEAQETTVTWYAGTADETTVQGVELIHLYTGAGDDRLDVRGIATNSGTFGTSNHFEAGAGDDTFATDLMALGDGSFVGGTGLDRLILDWRDATSTVLYNSNSNGVYYNTAVTGYGFVNQYFTGVEMFTLLGGSAADTLNGAALDDVLSGGGGNDRLNAGDGADSVAGGTGNDTILLGAGDDTANGGVGNDTITGSGGADRNVAVYADALSGILVEALADGSYRLTTATEGVDILRDVQVLRLDADGITVEMAIADAVNTAPVLPEDAAFAFVEGEVGTLFTALANDPQGHALTYGLSGPDATFFEIDPATGALGFAPSVFDGLTPSADGDGVYEVIVTASDSLLEDAQALSITINPPNFVPELVAPVDPQNWLNGNAHDLSLASVFTDGDGEALVLALTLADGSALPPWLGFNPASGLLSADIPTDVTGPFTLRLSATDPKEATTTTEFAITVASNLITALPEGGALDGTALNDRMQGLEGNDSFQALGGDDWLDGGDAADLLDGGAGDDTILGGLGGDTMLGDAGRDSLEGERGNDVMNGGTQADMLIGGNGNDTLIGGYGADSLLGSNGNDLLRGDDGADILIGGNGNDRLVGLDGNDAMTGGSGGDRLYGGRNNDDLHGGFGNDLLGGGVGDDTLNGGGNNDRLTGGAGGDSFVFDTANFGDDTIADFTPHAVGAEADRLHFGGGFAEVGDAAGFIAASTQVGTDVVYDLNGDGVNRIVLTGVTLTDLAADDFRFF